MKNVYDDDEDNNYPFTTIFCTELTLYSVTGKLGGLFGVSIKLLCSRFVSTFYFLG